MKMFPSRDLAVKVITYDSEAISTMKTIAEVGHARPSPTSKSWNVPRWSAQEVRSALWANSWSVSIVLENEAEIGVTLGRSRL